MPLAVRPGSARTLLAARNRGQSAGAVVVDDVDGALRVVEIIVVSQVHIVGSYLDEFHAHAAARRTLAQRTAHHRRSGGSIEVGACGGFAESFSIFVRCT